MRSDTDTTARPSHVQTSSSLDEHVVLLDSRGRPRGTAPKAEVHDAHTPLHLAFSCHIVRSDGSVLLTRRALDKPTWPGVWTNGCCGHPQLGESLREAVTRRLAEELGLYPVAMAVALPDFTYRAEMADGTVEHELCPVVVAVVDGVLIPDPAEVAEVAWSPWPEVVERAEHAPETLSPWSVTQIGHLAELTASATHPSLASWLDSMAGEDPDSTLDARIAVPLPEPTAAVRPAVSSAVGDDGFDPLAPLAEPLRRLLEEFLADRSAQLGRLDPTLDEMTQEIRALVAAGGKRLRPAFVYWGHRATGADHDPAVLRPAGAVELLHTFALLHDDVMDRSAVRRGRPSAHRALAQAGEDEWFGYSGAILAGDLAYVWADELFDATALPPDALARARRVFTELRTEVIAGQYLDLRLATQPQAPEAQAARVALLKSARYTVTRPLLLGAALGPPDGGGPLQSALQAYGDAVGIAFQLRDDILGLFGDPALTGKSALDDLREGKRTVLMLRSLALVGDADRALLTRSLGDPTMSEAQAERVRDVVRASGALASVEALLAAKHAAALDAIAGLPEPARGALQTLAALAIERRG